jgi:hypothetical protein
MTRCGLVEVTDVSKEPAANIYLPSLFVFLFGMDAFLHRMFELIRHFFTINN